MKINIILFVIFGFIIAYTGCKDTTTGIDQKTIPSSNVLLISQISTLSPPLEGRGVGLTYPKKG